MGDVRRVKDSKEVKDIERKRRGKGKGAGKREEKHFNSYLCGRYKVQLINLK